MSQHYRSILQLSGGVTPFVNEYSMSFDGIDERFNVGTSSLGITNAITVSAWVKIPTTNTGGGGTNIQVIACEDNTTSGQRNWNLFWRGTGYNYFAWVIHHTNLSISSVTSTGVVPNDGQWHHLLGTFDGTTNANGIKLYIDGVLNVQGTAGSTGINSFTATETTIGALTGGNSWRFEGTIDEVAIWNSDQSSNINSIYSPSGALDLSSLNPLSWWRMGDGDSFSTNWTLIDNGSGGNDATSVNMEEADRLPISPNSYSLNSFSFDGVDEYMNVANNTTIGRTQNISFSVWMKSNTTARQWIIGNPTSSNGGAGLYVENTNILIFQLGDGTNDSYFNSRVSSLSTYAPTGQWNHILATFDGTDAKIFINGVLRNTWSPTTPYTISGWSNFYIGRRQANLSNMFNGNLDEVAMWDNDQSANISTIFNNGVPTDISSLNPLSHWRMGESATWNGSIWTLTDQGSGGNNATSVNMEEADKTGDQPYVI